MGAPARPDATAAEYLSKDDPAMLQTLRDLSSKHPRTATAASFTLLVAAALFLYLPALPAPWYMDDTAVIVGNPVIRDLGLTLRELFTPRGPALFSFALNYRLGALDPYGYRLVNVVLHGLCAGLVLLLLRRIWPQDRLLVWSGAMLFLCHPLQTQAVNYVVQRMTVLAAAFFLLALELWLRSRQHRAAGMPFAAPKHLFLYIAALLCGAGAVLTKENTAVFPLVAYCVCRLVPGQDGERRTLLPALLPFCGVPLLLAARYFAPVLLGETTLATVAGTARLANTEHLSVLHYLVTEWGVVWVYLRLVLFPVGQALDHSYPLVTSLFSPWHLLGGLGLFGLGAIALWLRHRRPLLSLGIAWFLLTLAVESTLIPLDPLFEHRLYLPLFGLLLIALDLLRGVQPPRLRSALFGLLLIGCLIPTWQRNRLWADPVALYRDNLQQAPESERVPSDLAAIYLDQHRHTEAEPLLLRSIARNPRFLDAYVNLTAVYAAQGRLTEATTIARRGLELAPRSAQLQSALGSVMYRRGERSEALHLFEGALQSNPHDALAASNRATILAEAGRWPEAISAFRQALTMRPDDVVLRNDLALALLLAGEHAAAEAELQQVLLSAPNNADALERLARLALKHHDDAALTRYARRLQQADPRRLQQLEASVGRRILP